MENLCSPNQMQHLVLLCKIAERSQLQSAKTECDDSNRCIHVIESECRKHSSVSQ